MTNIAISGASGRMGRTLISAVLASDSLTLSAAVDQPNSDVIGTDAGTMVGQRACGVLIGSEINQMPFDILIDFTRPAATLEYLLACQNNNQAAVIGTTGFTADQKQQITQAAQSMPIVFAANMSIGVNLSFKLMELAAGALASQADIEIIEAHHKHKVDAPSGTALAMGEVIAKAVNRPLNEYGVFARHGHTGVRKDGEIGFSTIRSADIIGEHTALFGLEGERIEITHKASNRNIYANGALEAARWLARQSQPGLFNMQNVLGLG